MIKDYFIVALGSLTRRYLRTSLTMLGIFIGVAAVVALISLGQGMQAAVNGQFAAVGTDKIMIQGATATFLPPGQNTAGQITKHDLQLVRSTQGIGRAAGRLLKQANAEYAKETQVLFTASLPQETADRTLIMEANNFKIAEGRMLKPNEKKRIVVGQSLATKKKFSKPVTIGAKIKLNNINFEVTGILQKMGAGKDNLIIINEADLRELFGATDEYSMIVAQISEGEEPSKIADKISRTIRRDRHQKEGFEDFTVQTSESLLTSINTILGVVQAVFIGIALISLLVGGIGIMNTMYTSVLERTREIGIMKAIGARNKDIFFIFFIESGLLGMTGGAIGIMLGIGMSKMVEFAAKDFAGEMLKATFPTSLIIGALAFSFVIGAASGVMPAKQASKMQPVEALRYD